MKNNPLVKRVIAVLDRNKDGTISFLEFVQGLNSLSAGASQEDKLRFAFQIYDINNDGFISNGELFQVLKMMVGDNLNDVQLQQLVDRTIVKADTDFDGKISFEEFCVVSATPSLNLHASCQPTECAYLALSVGVPSPPRNPTCPLFSSQKNNNSNIKIKLTRPLPKNTWSFKSLNVS